MTSLTSISPVRPILAVRPIFPTSPVRPANAISNRAISPRSSAAVVVYPAMPAHPTRQVQAVVEITVGPDPEKLLQQAASQVRHPGLQGLLIQFLDEPEIRQVLTRLDESQGIGTKHPTLPIQQLRRAAELAQYWCAFGREEREVLYVATLLQGCQSLLESTLSPGASAADVLFTIVRSSLHRLDDRYPRQAFLLRLSLGWGNADEGDEYYVPRLQQSVERALSKVTAQSSGRKLKGPAANRAVYAGDQVASQH